LDARTRIPQNVVFREFAQETVVLNLDTGKYHGLNPTAGRMIQALENADTVRAAAASLAHEFPDAGADLEYDLCHFCLALAERGLVELGD